MQIHKETSQVEVCNHCGDSVARGSGKFVNRVPNLNDVSTRAANNNKFPLGDYICDYCDTKSSNDNE